MKMVLIGPVQVGGAAAHFVALAVTMPDAASMILQRESACNR